MSFKSKFKYDFPYQKYIAPVKALSFMKVKWDPDRAPDFLEVLECICPRCKEKVKHQTNEETFCMGCGAVLFSYFESFGGLILTLRESKERLVEQNEKMKEEQSARVEEERNKAVVSNEYIKTLQLLFEQNYSN